MKHQKRECHHHACPSYRYIAKLHPDLGMKAIHEFEVEDMPVTVAVDVNGTAAHNTGPAEPKQRINEHALHVK